MSTSATAPEDMYRGIRRADLDPTPVKDLEAWHREYDPRAAAALDRRLDEAFGGAR